MNGDASPFGNYQAGLATVVTLAIIVSWLVGLLFNPSGVTETLNNAAWAALGYVLAKPVGENVVNTLKNRVSHLETNNGKEHSD